MLLGVGLSCFLHCWLAGGLLSETDIELFSGVSHCIYGFVLLHHKLVGEMSINKNILIVLLTLSFGIVAQNCTKTVDNSSDKVRLENKDFKIPCGDLLSVYAEKPKELRFIKCEKIKDSQTIVRATYQVAGTKSKVIEDFLVKTYGMGKLKWTCCGWDNAGKYGVFEYSEFKKINRECLALISMYASAEVQDKSKQSKVRLETDRNKIAFFTVIVELVII